MSVSFQGAAAGAAGGFAMGGPVGAGLGALAGFLSGGSSEQNSRIVMRDWTPQEREAVNAIMKQYPGAIEAMDPKQRQALFERTRDAIRKEGYTQVENQFREAKGNLDLGMARTGGNLGSISLYHKGELARQEGEAKASVDRGANLTGEQVAGNRMNENMNRVNTLGGNYANLWGNRVIGQDTTVPNNNPGAGGMMMLGAGLMNENSYFNKNHG